MMNSQRRDAEKIKLIEEGKKIGINDFINCNKIKQFKPINMVFTYIQK